MCTQSAARKLQGRPSSVGNYTHKGQFQLLEELQVSNTGSVHLARVLDAAEEGPKHVILKCRRVAELGKEKDLLNEYEVLKRLDHPNVIYCHGYFWDPDTQSVVIVLEYAERGDLHRELQSRQKSGDHFSDTEVWDIFMQVLMGLEHMHSKGIVHRDIKSLNLLLTSDGIVKLGDFGVSRQMSENTLCLNSFYGTPLYLSPELIAGKPYSETTDMWSLGVVLYELLVLTPPFDGQNLQEVVCAVARGHYAPLPSWRPPELRALVGEILVHDPDKRPTSVTLVKRFAKKLHDASCESGPATCSDQDGLQVVRVRKKSGAGIAPGPCEARQRTVPSNVRERCRKPSETRHQGRFDSDGKDQRVGPVTTNVVGGVVSSREARWEERRRAREQQRLPQEPSLTEERPQHEAEQAVIPSRKERVDGHRALSASRPRSAAGSGDLFGVRTFVPPARHGACGGMSPAAGRPFQHHLCASRQIEPSRWCAPSVSRRAASAGAPSSRDAQRFSMPRGRYDIISHRWVES